ncbi:hypothetical protein RSOCI_02895 [Rhabdochlamydiaceae symbiont of Dictyostelium giganteum]
MMSSIQQFPFSSLSVLNTSLQQAITKKSSQEIEQILSSSLAETSPLLGEGICALMEQEGSLACSFIQQYRATINACAMSVKRLFMTAVTQANQKPYALPLYVEYVITVIDHFNFHEITLDEEDKNTLGVFHMQLMKQVHKLSHLFKKISALKGLTLDENKNHQIEKLLHTVSPYIVVNKDMHFSSYQEALLFLEGLKKHSSQLEKYTNKYNDLIVTIFSKHPSWIKLNQLYGLGHLLFYALSHNNFTVIPKLMDHPDLSRITSHLNPDGSVNSYGFFELLQELIGYAFEASSPAELDYAYFPDKLLNKMTPDSQFIDNPFYSYENLIEDTLSFDFDIFKKIVSIPKVQVIYQNMIETFDMNSLLKLDDKKNCKDAWRKLALRVKLKRRALQKITNDIHALRDNYLHLQTFASHQNPSSFLKFYHDNPHEQFLMNLIQPKLETYLLELRESLIELVCQFCKKSKKMRGLVAEKKYLARLLKKQEKLHEDYKDEMAIIVYGPKAYDDASLLHRKHEAALNSYFVGGMTAQKFLIPEELSSFKLDEE